MNKIFEIYREMLFYLKFHEIILTRLYVNFQTNDRNLTHQREPMMIPTNAVRDTVNQFAAHQER